jgi:hypothetical protein
MGSKGTTAASEYESQLADADGYETVQGSGGGDFAEMHDFDVEPVLFARYTGSHTANTRFGERTVYEFVRDSDGEKTEVWGTAILSDRMEDLDFGVQVRLERLGKIQTGGGQAWDWRVGVKASAMKDAG